jgi:hypothetical protein
LMDIYSREDEEKKNKKKRWVFLRALVSIVKSIVGCNYGCFL